MGINWRLRDPESPRLVLVSYVGGLVFVSTTSGDLPPNLGLRWEVFKPFNVSVDRNDPKDNLPYDDNVSRELRYSREETV